MGRPIDENLRQLLDAEACEAQSTLELRLMNGTVIRSATRELTASGQTFTDDLRKVGEIVQSAFANVDRATSQTQNVDRQIGLKILNGSIDKAEAIIGRYYEDQSNPAKNAWVELFRGEAKPTQINPVEALIEIVDDLVAAGYCVADWTLEPACPYRFKDENCGYTGDAPPCVKNLETCRILHRFGGMESKIETVSVVPGNDGGGLGGGLGEGTCFVAGTMIDTPEGAIEIENVKTRTEIYSFHPETLQMETDAVIAALEHIADGYFELITGGEKRISVTPKHPFLTAINTFTAARNLAIGQTLFVRSGEKLVETTLEKRHWVGARVRVYNLHVARNQTYFANGLAVRNRKGDFDPFLN